MMLPIRKHRDANEREKICIDYLNNKIMGYVKDIYWKRAWEKKSHSEYYNYVKEERAKGKSPFRINVEYKLWRPIRCFFQIVFLYYLLQKYIKISYDKCKLNYQMPNAYNLRAFYLYKFDGVYYQGARHTEEDLCYCFTVLYNTTPDTFYKFKREYMGGLLKSMSEFNRPGIIGHPDFSDKNDLMKKLSIEFKDYSK